MDSKDLPRMTLIGIDPGGITGYCEWFHDKNSPHLVGAAKFDHEVWELLKRQESPHVCWVVEDYRVRPANQGHGWQHQWDKGEAFQVIGAIKSHAHIRNQKIYLQQPSILPIGYKLLGKERSKSEARHTIDAIAHVAYFLHKHRGPFRVKKD